MAHSGRFSLSLRILAVLAAAPNEMHTSSEIAEELAESAVVIRRVFLLLERGGLIEQRRGRKGGAKLKAAAQKIGVGDVYLAAEGDWLLSGDRSVSTLLEQAREDGLVAMNETTFAQILKRMGKKSISASRTDRQFAKVSRQAGDSERGLARGDKSFAVGVRGTLRSLIPTTSVRSGSYA